MRSVFQLAIIKFDLKMLTAQQKAQAERKLKSLNEEKQHEEQIKSKVKSFSKVVNDTINSIKQEPKKQLQILRNLINTDFVQKIASFEASNLNFQELQEKMKTRREQLSKQALLLIEQEGRYKKGVEEIKQTIVNIQKTVKESVQQEAKKRKKIEDDLEKSLDDIRAKITQFQAESQKFDKQNVELQEKINTIKEKLNGIEQTFKVKAQQKDQEVKAERDQLTNKLAELEVEVQKATELNKEYAAIQKQNFDNKIALYLRTKKFPEFSSSFESSANTLHSCKQELLKGVQRMNVATESIEQSNKIVEQINHQYLIQLKKQQEKQQKIQEIKKEKEVVRAHILQLQNKLKEKKSKTQA